MLVRITPPSPTKGPVAAIGTLVNRLGLDRYMGPLAMRPAAAASAIGGLFAPRTLQPALPDYDVVQRFETTGERVTATGLTNSVRFTLQRKSGPDNITWTWAHFTNPDVRAGLIVHTPAGPVLRVARTQEVRGDQTIVRYGLISETVLDDENTYSTAALRGIGKVASSQRLEHVATEIISPEIAESAGESDLRYALATVHARTQTSQTPDGFTDIPVAVLEDSVLFARWQQEQARLAAQQGQKVVFSGDLTSYRLHQLKPSEDQINRAIDSLFQNTRNGSYPAHQSDYQVLKINELAGTQDTITVDGEKLGSHWNLLTDGTILRKPAVTVLAIHKINGKWHTRLLIQGRVPFDGYKKGVSSPAGIMDVAGEGVLKTMVRELIEEIAFKMTAADSTLTLDQARDKAKKEHGARLEQAILERGMIIFRGTDQSKVSTEAKMTGIVDVTDLIDSTNAIAEGAVGDAIERSMDVDLETLLDPVKRAQFLAENPQYIIDGQLFQALGRLVSGSLDSDFLSPEEVARGAAIAGVSLDTSTNHDDGSPSDGDSDEAPGEGDKVKKKLN